MPRRCVKKKRPTPKLRALAPLLTTARGGFPLLLSVYSMDSEKSSVFYCISKKKRMRSIPRTRRRDSIDRTHSLLIFREPLNKSSAALSGSFVPTDRFENLEIHKVFLQFPNLNLETKSLADRSCDLIRGSLVYTNTPEKSSVFIAFQKKKRTRIPGIRCRKPID